MILIVLDTTTLVETWTCDSAHWRALFLKADAGEVRIGVPQVVLREFERRFRSEAREVLKEYRRAEGKVRKLMPSASSGAPDGQDDDEGITDAFGTVRGRLLEHAKVLPLPGVSHETLLDADLGRTKPFNDAGKGYRDALIWHSLLEAGAASPDCDVWLVTNNVADFTLTKGDADQLAPELLQQAEEAGLGPVKWARNLKYLIEALADYRPARIAAGKGIEFVSEVPPPSREDALAEEAIDVAHAHLLALDFGSEPRMRYGYPELRHELGIPLEIESLTVKHVEIDSAACDLVDDDYEDAELWNVIVRATLSLSGFALKGDWAEIDDADNFWVDDGDWNDHMMSVEGNILVDVTVSILIDSSLYVLGADVESVEQHDGGRVRQVQS